LGRSILRVEAGDAPSVQLAAVVDMACPKGLVEKDFHAQKNHADSKN